MTCVFRVGKSCIYRFVSRWLVLAGFLGMLCTDAGIEVKIKESSWRVAFKKERQAPPVTQGGG